MRLRTVLHSKIHRATVTEADVDYIGSLTLDADLMDAADLHENEKISIADVDNGERLDTYVIRGERGSGIVGINGAAALRIGVGDKVIIFCYAQVSEDDLKDHRPRIVFVDQANRIARQADVETARTKMV